MQNQAEGREPKMASETIRIPEAQKKAQKSRLFGVEFG
jgi:hypothetical protein